MTEVTHNDVNKWTTGDGARAGASSKFCYFFTKGTVFEAFTGRELDFAIRISKLS